MKLQCNFTGREYIAWVVWTTFIYIYIYAFSRRFYPKRRTVHSGYTFVLLVCVFPGNRTHNLCSANAMLYLLSHRNTFMVRLISIWTILLIYVLESLIFFRNKRQIFSIAVWNSNITQCSTIQPYVSQIDLKGLIVHSSSCGSSTAVASLLPLL